jgi:hypothetical protein
MAKTKRLLEATCGYFDRRNLKEGLLRIASIYQFNAYRAWSKQSAKAIGLPTTPAPQPEHKEQKPTLSGPEFYS